MRHWFAQFASEDQGQDLVEYALLAIFLALAVGVGIAALASDLNTGFSNVGTQVSTGS